MIRFIVIAALLAHTAAAQNWYVVTNDTAQLDRYARHLVINNDQMFRYRAFARQGNVPKNLTGKILEWRLYAAGDGYRLASSEPTVLDATNGEFLVAVPLDRPLGDFVQEVVWYEASNSNYLGRLAWDNVTIQRPPPGADYIIIVATNNIGNTSVSNLLINTISNRVDANVTIPGLTVNVDNVTVPLERLTAVGAVSGLVATTQGDGSVSWLDRAGAVDAYATTNYLARVDTIRVGAGLIGSIDGGALKIEYLGQGLPPMPPGSAITNVVAYTPGGANTGMWVQASSGVTSWYVHAVGAGGGGFITHAGGLGGTSVAMLRVTPLAWYYVEVGAAGASGYTMTNSMLTANTNAASYPGGGLGWTRGSIVGANGGGYSAIWDGAPDRATATNLMLIAGGGGGAGVAGTGGGGGGASAWNGAGATVNYIAAGANGTNVALAVPWASCIVTGQSPGLLVGGDAQVLTNAQAGVNSGSGGGGGGYGGGAGGVSLSNSIRGGGGGGSGYINTAYVIAVYDRPAITIRAPLASSESVPSLSESPEYLAYGGVGGMSGQNGVVIIGEVISL